MSKRHEIPTHLNVEDKAIWGMSITQVMNMIAGCAGTYQAWNQWPWMPLWARCAIAAISLVMTLAFTFLRPFGRRLDEWALVALRYLATPKVSRWVTREQPADEQPATGEWQELKPAVAWEAGA